jgi:hypothetical protein
MTATTLLQEAYPGTAWMSFAQSAFDLRERLADMLLLCRVHNPHGENSSCRLFRILSDDEKQTKRQRVVVAGFAVAVIM